MPIRKAWASVTTLLEASADAFKTKRAYCWAFLIIIGFCLGGAHAGVAGIIRVLALSPHCYTSALAFFRSPSINLSMLRETWVRTILKAFREQIFLVDGRPVVAVDEIKVGKEGKRMPASRSTYQSSQNNSKPSFIMGHTIVTFAFVILSKTGYARAIPFLAQILGGLRTGPKHAKSAIDNTVELLIDIRDALPKSFIVVADALYAVKPFIGPLLEMGITVISRMGTTAVGFYIPPERSKKKPGRPRRYGPKVKLISLFDDLSKFTVTRSPIPGENVEIRILSLTLMTKWLKDKTLFVLVDHPSRGRIILVSSDLHLKPVDVYLAYYHRFQIECTFKQLKHSLYAFSYRFWSMAMTKIKRGAKDHHIHRKTTKEKREIHSTFFAYHVFVQLALMAFGVLSFVSVFHPEAVYKSFGGWLRTIRPNIMPSIDVTSEALGHSVEEYFASVLAATQNPRKCAGTHARGPVG